MNMRRLTFMGAALVIANTGCFHSSRGRLRFDEQVNLPPGLDSAGTVQWLAQQRARCPGELRVGVDHMPMISLDGSPVPYHSGIVAVLCARPSASTFDHP